jgi:hypothetical protein
MAKRKTRLSEAEEQTELLRRILVRLEELGQTMREVVKGMDRRG